MLVSSVLYAFFFKGLLILIQLGARGSIGKHPRLHNCPRRLCRATDWIRFLYFGNRRGELHLSELWNWDEGYKYNVCSAPHRKSNSICLAGVKIYCRGACWKLQGRPGGAGTPVWPSPNGCAHWDTCLLLHTDELAHTSSLASYTNLRAHMVIGVPYQLANMCILVIIPFN